MKNRYGVIKFEIPLWIPDGGGWLCQDFKTGELVWNEKRALSKGAIACADGKFYLVEESTGNVVLIDASYKDTERRFQLIPQTKQRSPQGRYGHTRSSATDASTRDQEMLYCYDIKEDLESGILGR